MALLALVALVAAACSGGDGQPTSTTAATTTTAAVPTTEAATSTTGATSTSLGVNSVRVAPDGSGDAPDLASALAAIAPGGTILLQAGEHILGGPLLIEAPVAIRGMGSGRTTVIGENAPELLRFTGPGDFTLEGITFRYLGTEEANVLVADGGTISFTDIVVSGAVRGEQADGAGFLVLGDASGTVEHCTAEENQGPGFLFGGTTDIRVADSTGSANGGPGFAWSGQAAGAIAASTAEGNGFSGFVVLNGARPTLTDNRSEENGDDGFLFKQTSRAIVARNQATGNAWAGFRWVDQASGTAEANTASGNSDGFWVADQADPTLIGNASYGHHAAAGNGSGLVYSGTAGGAARLNEVYDNDWGVAIGVDATPSLEDNDVHDNTSNQVINVTFN